MSRKGNDLNNRQTMIVNAGETVQQDKYLILCAVKLCIKPFNFVVEYQLLLFYRFNFRASQLQPPLFILNI